LGWNSTPPAQLGLQVCASTPVGDFLMRVQLLPALHPPC
jgi:hypothetical protein